MADTREYNHADLDALRAALVGRSVVAVEMLDRGSTDETIGKWGPTVQGVATLDDGRVLKLSGNDGGCSCGAGDYELTRLNAMPVNGIMDVQIDVDDSQVDEWGEGHQTYRLFVLAQDNRIELATFEGNDGNGYYGTGFWFTVTDGEEVTP